MTTCWFSRLWNDGVEPRKRDGDEANIHGLFERSKKKRGLSVGPVGGLWQVREPTGREECFHHGSHVHGLSHLPKDDFVWFLARSYRHRSTGRTSSGTVIHCACCGCRSKAKDMSCAGTVQYGNSLDSCLLFRAESPRRFAIISGKQSSWLTTCTQPGGTAKR